MTVTELAPRFFLAAVVILLVCRGVSWALGRVRQPPVVGEMIAGVLLGPSLLGLLAPGLERELFPPALLPVLYVVGQVGLVAFMFQAGHEFRSYLSRAIAGTAVTVSAAGITVPLVLGAGLTFLARGHVDIFVPGVSTGVSAAFVGVALAITAFPMLARIITERGLAGSRFGSLALASGALDDVVAWILLAGILSVHTGRTRPVLEAVGGAALFAAVVVLVLRKLLDRAMAHPRMSEEARLLVTVAVLFTAAWFTDEVGLYSVFGAFGIGMAMPRTAPAERVVHTTSYSTRTVFLPMFFTYSGLNTRFSLLDRPALLLFSLAAVVAAVIGKFGACWAVARLRGEPNAVAARLGTLMNARGLMQLIALNVGLQAGLVNHSLFTALVLVALVTTVMTSPLLSLLDRRSPVPDPDQDPAAAGLPPVEVEARLTAQ
ncbi:cation:proton antiporter [Streptacidiphilus sp. N1-3]|uniref:Cation:proton antiporter n=1 Tax=Streptacidiphilus alkalitolerans TaxID=3342712 RepID=A0ABV6XD54_9ACTN